MGVELVASVVGLASTAEVVITRVYKYVRSVKHAEREVLELSSQLNSLYGALKSVALIANELKGVDANHVIGDDQIQQCASCLDRLRDKLSQYQGKGSLENSSMLKRKMFKWPFTERETLEIKAKIEACKTGISLALTADGLSQSLKILESVESSSTKLHDVQTRLETMRQIELTKDNEKILDALCQFRPTDHQRTNSKLRQSNTGSWFLDGQYMKDWLSTNNSKLWVYGIPGAGKSILASGAANKLLSLGDADNAVVYFYCDYKMSVTQDLKTILGSLLVQLARQDERSFDKVQDFFYKHCDRKEVCSFVCDPEDLFTLLAEVADGFDTVAMLVDGLDECGSNSEDAASFLADLVRKSSRVKTILFSRDIPEIRECMHDFTTLSIAAENTDLRLYVGHEIEERMKRGSRKRLHIKDPDIKGEIMDVLINGAQGCFRWVAVQLDYLCNLASDTDIRQALTNLPLTLDSSYERLLYQILDQPLPTQAYVQRAIKWVTWEGPLALEELLDILAVRPDTQQLNPASKPDGDAILRSCGSLIRQNPNDDRIELAHFTVKEYLCAIDAARAPNLRPFFAQEIEDKKTLAIQMGVYLCCDNFQKLSASEEDVRSRGAEYPFRKTAVLGWDDWVGSHIGEEGMRTVVERPFDESRLPQLRSWAQELLYYRCKEIHWHDMHNEYFKLGDWHLLTRLHFASLLHLPFVCEKLVMDGAGSDAWSTMGTPLHLALLGTRFLDMSTRTADLYGQDMFFEPEDQDRYRLCSTLKILVSHGADVNRRSTSWRNRDAESPLKMAVRYVSHNAEPPELLLQAGARVEKDCCDLLNRVLSDVSDVVGHLAAVFIQRIKLQSVNDDCKKAFSQLWNHAQACCRPPERSQLKGHIELEDDEIARECLLTSVHHGHLETLLAVLDEKESIVNTRDGHGQTALHIASSNHNQDIAKALIQRGANIDCANNKGQTPLLVALQCAGQDLIRLLLDHGADPLLTDNERNNVWCMAAQNPNPDALAVLEGLPRGVRALLNTTDSKAKNALRFAVTLETFKSLLDAGANQWERDEDGRSILHHAASSGKYELVEYLVSHGHDPATVLDNNSNNVLTILASDGRRLQWTRKQEVFQRLCQASPDLLFQESSTGECAFGVLLNQGAHSGYSVDYWSFAENAVTQNPLTAVNQHLKSLRSSKSPNWRMHRSVLDLFGQAIPKELTEKSLDLYLRTVLEKPTDAPWGKEPVLCFLVKRMTPDWLKSFRYISHQLINWAIWNEHDALIGILLDKGVDVTIQDDDRTGLNALQCALQGGSSDAIVQRMLQHTPDLAVRSIDSSTLLHFAVQPERSTQIRNLVNSGLSIESKDGAGRTPLLCAILYGHTENIRILLEMGADSAAKCDLGRDAYQYAALGGQVDVLKLLYDQQTGWPGGFLFHHEGTDYPEVRLTHLATWNGRLECLKYLLTFTSVFKLEDKAGEWSILDIAIFGQCLPIVNFLLERGAASLSADSSDGNTPLHLAVLTGKLEYVQAVLPHGFDPHATRQDGHSPLSIARYYSLWDIVRYLSQHRPEGLLSCWSSLENH